MREVTRQLREAGSLRGGRDYRRNFRSSCERFSSEAACDLLGGAALGSLGGRPHLQALPLCQCSLRRYPQ